MNPLVNCLSSGDSQIEFIPRFSNAVDYLALGAVRYLGQPKRRTVSVYSLVDQEYQVRLFRGDDRIVSPMFPELGLTAD
jgi:Uma2 family endonuclease